MNIGIIGSGVVAQTLGSSSWGRGTTSCWGRAIPTSSTTRRCSAARCENGNRKAKTAQGRDLQGGGRPRGAAGQRHLGAGLDRGAQAGGADKVGAKVLLDVANELDFSKGMPPAVLASQERCLAEKIQAAFPNLKVVKSLNTINAS